MLRVQIPLKFVIKGIRVGGLGGCIFIFTMVLRIGWSLKHFFFWKSGYSRVKTGEIPNTFDFWSTMCFSLKNLKILFFSLKCSSPIPKLYSENRFQIRAVFNETHAFKIFLYDVYKGVILSKLWVMYKAAFSILHIYHQATYLTFIKKNECTKSQFFCQASKHWAS